MFKRGILSRKAIRKSQRLFPFVKMIEKHGGVPLHLNSLILVSLLDIYGVNKSLYF